MEIFGIAAGLVATLFYLIRRLRNDARNRRKKLETLAGGVAAIDLRRMPEHAAALRRYVYEKFGVELSRMDFAGHVRYIGKHLRKLSRWDDSSCFPAGENEFIAAVIADLSELIIARYPAGWVRREEPSHFPLVGIEFPDGKKTWCDPGKAVLMQLCGSCGVAVAAEMLPFENPDRVQRMVAEIADSYHREGEIVTLEFNRQILKNLLFTRRTACGLVLSCYLLPLLFIGHQVDRPTLFLTGVGWIGGTIFGILLFKDRWMLWELVKYHRLTLLPDCFCLESDHHDALRIAYEDVRRCRTGNASAGAAEGAANAAFLQIKTKTHRIRLPEDYFLNHNAAKEVFAEIERRVAVARGKGGL